MKTDPQSSAAGTKNGRISADPTGLPAPDRQAQCARKASPERALSTAWVSDELLAETRDVWSEAYGYEIDDAEAMEILMNVKRLGEVLMRARKEIGHT